MKVGTITPHVTTRTLKKKAYRSPADNSTDSFKPGQAISRAQANKFQKIWGEIGKEACAYLKELEKNNPEKNDTRKEVGQIMKDLGFYPSHTKGNATTYTSNLTAKKVSFSHGSRSLTRGDIKSFRKLIEEEIAEDPQFNQDRSKHSNNSKGIELNAQLSSNKDKIKQEKHRSMSTKDSSVFAEPDSLSTTTLNLIVDPSNTNTNLEINAPGYKENEKGKNHLENGRYEKAYKCFEAADAVGFPAQLGMAISYLEHDTIVLSTESKVRNLKTIIARDYIKLKDQNLKNLYVKALYRLHSLIISEYNRGISSETRQFFIKVLNDQLHKLDLQINGDSAKISGTAPLLTKNYQEVIAVINYCLSGFYWPKPDVSNTELFIEYLTKASNNNCIEALLDLAKFYLHRAGNKKENNYLNINVDISTAETYLRQAKDQGSQEASYQLAKLLLKKHEKTLIPWRKIADLKEAFKLLEECASKNDARAMRQLSAAYCHQDVWYGMHQVVTYNHQSAIVFCEKAANLGDVSAKAFLLPLRLSVFSIYRASWQTKTCLTHLIERIKYGIITVEQFFSDLQHMDQAAQQGDEFAQIIIAMIMIKGINKLFNGTNYEKECNNTFPRNLRRGQEILHGIAQKGLSKKVWVAVLCLVSDIENPDNRKKGMMWLEQAANIGHIEACYFLVQIYLCGLLNPNAVKTNEAWWFLPPDWTKSSFYFRKYVDARKELVKKNSQIDSNYYDIVVLWYYSICSYLFSILTDTTIRQKLSVICPFIAFVALLNHELYANNKN